MKNDVHLAGASAGELTDTAVVVRERPILFQGPMVRAILNGTKTQTRRVVKPQPPAEALAPVFENGWWMWQRFNAGRRHFDGKTVDRIWDKRCPYGVPGDRLWVRETWRKNVTTGQIYYRADGYSWTQGETRAGGTNPIFRPSIHMPRAACRITLGITEVRVQRLQDISEEDAKAEGCAAGDDMRNELFDPNTGRMTCAWIEPAPNAKESFCNLWQLTYKRPRGEDTAWEENPWVWVVTFVPVNSPDTPPLK